jgi:hypothetical protein
MRPRAAVRHARGGRIPPNTPAPDERNSAGTRAWLAVVAAQLLLVLWLFGPALFQGRVLFFRDLSTYYAPAYAFAASWLKRGVWPLWNPTANAGEPFLLAYPVDLVVLWLGGMRAALGVGPALHLLLALGGASLLARRLGMGAWGGAVAGTVYGLGGLVLSTVSLVPLFQAAALAPWVIAAFLAAAREPTARRVAALAALAALQISTLGAEILAQTAVAGVLLLEDAALVRTRRLLRIVGAGVLALLLAAPALLGARALLAGTAREHGFARAEALAFSLHPAVLAEMVLPKFLGDPHAFSDRDYWGRAYFPEGYPYFVSLYLGLPVLLLAVGARGRGRLWLLAAIGVVLSSGSYGPLRLLPDTIRSPVRGPQKLVFLTHLALALLAGAGLERWLARRPRGPSRWLLALPGLAWLGVLLTLRLEPSAVRTALAAALPPLADPRGLVAARELWPGAWLPSAALTLTVGLALALGGAWARATALLVTLDLLIVNGGINPLAPPSFYDLRSDVADLVRGPAREGTFRWFSYGVALTPGLRFTTLLARAPSDVWLYYLDRQSLLPRTHVLDGLEGGMDIDRTGWSPSGSTVPVEEATPERFASHQPLLRLANVRWVLSFRPLPAALATRRGEVRMPEIESPLRLYEIRDALPRAFYEPPGGGPPPVAGDGVVAYTAPDPHTVRLAARTPPGLLVVLDAYHADWRAEDRSGPVPLQVALGRYRAVPTRGGDTVITLRYRPWWRTPALALSAMGALAALVLALRR